MAVSEWEDDVTELLRMGTRVCVVGMMLAGLAGCASSAPAAGDKSTVYQESYPVLFEAAQHALRAMQGRIQGEDERTGQILALFDQGPQYGDLELGVQIARPRGLVEGWEVHVATLLPPKADGSDSWLREAAELRQEFYRRLEQALLLHTP